jgi:predicted nucleic acid-binding protein
VILDTCFVIDLIAEDPNAVGKLDEIEEERIGVTPFTIYEVGVGLSGQERRRFYDIMNRLSVYEFDAKIASRAVSEQRDLMENGEQIGVVDAMIGATALSTQQTVLTNNATEFKRLGCTVERY